VTDTTSQPRSAAAPVAGWPRGVLSAVRPRQWVKNALVVGAPLAAGRAFEPHVVRATGIAFVALCLASCAGYLVNDVHDAVEDRLHPRKRHRPVASGTLPVAVAVAAAGMLAVAALLVAWLASWPFVLLVAGYLVVTLAYSLRLRREPVLELVVVAACFVLRGAAGGVASGLPISSWFLLVAGAGSLLLVAGKRYAELVAERPSHGVRPVLAAYSPGYLRFVWATAANLTIITYALWADQVYRVREDGSWALWSLAPFVLGVLRYCLDVDRGTGEAPEDLVLHDHTLQVIGTIWVILFAVGAGSIDLGL
jgi:decaprenyl-phosphate phosphoribosyltransferase